MKDEIKEILDYFREFSTIRENNMLTKIEDYITNIQEELKYQEQKEQEYNEKHIELMKKCKELQKKYENAVADYELEKYKNTNSINFIETYLIPLGDDWHWDNASIRDDVIDLLNILKEDNILDKDTNYMILEKKINKEIPMLKELNTKIKEIIETWLDIKEIHDIEEILKGEDNELTNNEENK